MSVTTTGLFVYGTLRPGQPLERLTWAAATEDGQPRRAHLRGYRLYWNWGRSYPYMVATADPRDVVRGTWFRARSGDALTRILEIELGAGYSLELVHPYMGQVGLGPTFAFVLQPSKLEYMEAKPMEQVRDDTAGGLVYDWVRSKYDWDLSQIPAPAEEVENYPRLPIDSDT